MQTAILDVNIGLGDLLIELTGGKEIHKTGSEKANTQPPPSVQCRHLGILSGLGARPARTRDENYVYFIYSNLYPYPAPNTALSTLSSCTLTPVLISPSLTLFISLGPLWREEAKRRKWGPGQHGRLAKTRGCSLLLAQAPAMFCLGSLHDKTLVAIPHFPLCPFLRAEYCWRVVSREGVGVWEMVDWWIKQAEEKCVHHWAALSYGHRHGQT